MRRFRPTVVQIDLDAVRRNVGLLKPADAELMAVVKGDGYGHGEVPVARAALQAGATWLGVALVEEGLRLRAAGIDAPVLVLSEFPPGSEGEALAAGLTPSLYTDEGLAGLVAAGATRVHVKVDTGMHRVGLYPPEAAVGFVRRVLAAGLELEGLWTHFAKSEEDEGTTLGQLKLLREIADALAAEGIRPRLLHAANSAAVMLHAEAHLDLVRAGIAIYGIAPDPVLAGMLDLQPAMAWRSAVTMVKRLPAGEGISYGHRHRLERDANVATVPVGYADGYPRALSSKADVLIGGRRRRVSGAVTMDQILVDCGDDEVAPGDEVVLLGRQGDQAITADELAAHAGTITYEIVTSVGPRVPREYLGG